MLVVLVFAVASSFALMIVAWTRGPAQHFKRRSDERAVQRAHSRAAPRLGGLPLMGAALSALGAAAVLREPVDAKLLLEGALLILSVLPVFLAGLFEDAGRHVPPRLRLAAAALSGVLGIVLLGVWVDRVDVPALDAVVALPPIAAVLTITALAGVSHAFNLIDGLNGLAGLTGLVTALGFVAVARAGGSAEIEAMSGVLAAAIAGFLVLNFPGGRLFLGDAGAYAMGFALAMLGVIAIARMPDITPWAVLLILFWPVADTVLAIWRRWRVGRPADVPDRLHVHQLVMRAIEIGWLGRGSRAIANPLATALLLPMISMPIAAGVALRSAPGPAAGAVVGFAVLFVSFYLLGMRRAARLRRPLGQRLALQRTIDSEEVTA